MLCSALSPLLRSSVFNRSLRHLRELKRCYAEVKIADKGGHHSDLFTGSSAEHSRNGGECVEKPPHARIARGRDNPGTIAGDQLTLFDHADAIAERKRLTHVVRDDDHRLANALLNPAEFRVELGARQRIERAEWLV